MHIGAQFCLCAAVTALVRRAADGDTAASLNVDSRIRVGIEIDSSEAQAGNSAVNDERHMRCNRYMLYQL
jgi:hypothetical protein